MAATTRRPQINHRACDHAATPAARRACRKAHRAAEVAVVGNAFRSYTGLTHELVVINGEAVPGCSRRPTRGQAVNLPGWHAGLADCHKCSGTAAANRRR